MNPKCAVISALIFFLPSLVFSQSDSSIFSFEGYVEFYYGLDLGVEDPKERADFFYNHKRLGEFNLNIGYLKAKYADERLRGNFALMAGNYATYNLASEPAELRYIYEANMGVRLSAKKKIWLDVGVLPSHIGFESAIAQDCWTLTRSLIAENTPYYETGAKLSYENAAGTTFSVLLLNGWQHIQRPNSVYLPSLGTQLQTRYGENFLLNWSLFAGEEKVDQARIFSNLYGVWTPTEKWSFLLDFDYGVEQPEDKGDLSDSWWGGGVIGRFAPTSKIALAARAEYFSDKEPVIVTAANGTFEVLGLSANFDYWLFSKALVRLEAKHLRAQDSIFQKNQNQFTDTVTSLTASVSMKF